MLSTIAELIQCLPPPQGDAALTPEASLRARVDQLSAELEALSVSRAEALANAIEEREKRIAQHEQHVHLLQTVMMQAAEGFVTFDAEGTIESFNEAASRIFGCEPAEAVGGNIGMLVATAPADGGTRFVAGGLTPGPCREFVGRRNDGSLFPLDVAVSEVELHSRSIGTAVCRDITERKRADAELRRLHLQNEMILNSAGEGILGLDQDGTVIFANPAAARMLGREVAEVTGRGVGEMVHGCVRPAQDRTCANCLAQQAQWGSASCLSGSEAFRKRDGTQFPVDYTWRRTAEECGPVTGVLTFCDITERRRLEAQLRQAQKLESIGQLAAGIAHEINTPTQFIGDNLRFLEDGIQLLAEVARLAPDTVRMTLTGNVDQQTAVQAVNDGQVFRFLNKPCEPEDFAKALRAGLNQYRLVTTERELLSNTLGACVRLLNDLLSLVNPTAVGRASRVQRVVHEMCEAMRPDDAWAVELAAMLSQIGCVAVAQSTLEKVCRGEMLGSAEYRAYAAHPKIAADLLGRIPRLDLVAQIVAHQELRYDGVGGPPGAPLGEQIPFGSRILKFALDWDLLRHGDLSPEMAMATLCNRIGWYDPAVVEAVKAMHHLNVVHEIREVRLAELADGMILAEDVRSMNNTLLCAKGHEVTQALRICLRNYAVNVGLSNPIKVFVPASPHAVSAWQ